MRALLFLFLAPLCAWAQPSPVQPQSDNWLAERIEFEVRLKGDPTPTNSFPTVKVTTIKFHGLTGQRFTANIGCWQTASACPKVSAVTVKVFLQVPWIGRVNVSKYFLCKSSECLMPGFTPLVANVGQSYSFSYDRIAAKWASAPTVITP